MTMPDERMRALRWGFELLREVQADALVDEIDRSQAANLAATYPGPHDMLRWVLDDTLCISVEAATAIAQAAALFHRMRRKHMSDATRHALTYTLRHFPEADEALQRSKPVPGIPLQTWVLPEDQYR